MQKDHPCDHCVNLKWALVTSDHGTPVEIPYCYLDYRLAIAKCDQYEKE